MQTNAHPVIGIVGGIGSGKSLVAAELVKHGGYLIAGDPLGHEGLRQPDHKARTVARFGSAILDDHGEIDRRHLGRIVFADEGALRDLEAILFPYIGQRIREEIAKARTRQDIAFIILDAAVMLEAGWAPVCDHLIFVDAPAEVRLARLTQKRGWSPDEMKRREARQMPLAEKKAHADAVVDNSTTAESVQEQVHRILTNWNLKKSASVIQ